MQALEGRAEHQGGPAILFDKGNGGGAPGQRFQAEGAATGKDVKHSGVLKVFPKPVKQRFPAPPWGRTEAWARGYGHALAPERAADNAHLPAPLGPATPATLVSFFRFQRPVSSAPWRQAFRGVSHVPVFT